MERTAGNQIYRESLKDDPPVPESSFLARQNFGSKFPHEEPLGLQIVPHKLAGIQREYDAPY